MPLPPPEPPSAMYCARRAAMPVVSPPPPPPPRWRHPPPPPPPAEESLDAALALPRPGSTPPSTWLASVGRKRRAAFGNLSALGRESVMIVTLAVIPGRSLLSGLGTATSVV